MSTDTDRILGATQSGSEPDWIATVKNLMALAKEANNSFDFDRAYTYLSHLERIWDSKGLPEISIDLRFELYREKGKVFASQGKHEEAIREYQKILKYCRDSSHLVVKAETFNQVGQLLAKKGDHDRALGYLQRAIGAYRRLQDKPGMCKALRNLGVIYVQLGEFEEAELNYHEAVELAEGIRDRMLYADLVNNLGAIKNMKGNWEEALDLYHESLEIYEANDEIRKCAYTRNNLAITLCERGFYSRAFEYFLKAHKTALEIKDGSLALIVDINLADLYLKEKQYDQASAHCIRAEEHLMESKSVNGNLVETWKIAGKIAYQRKDYDTALQYFNDAHKTAREIGAKFLEAEVLMERGVLYGAMKRNLDALTDLEGSYAIYNSLKAEGKREQTERVIDSIEKLYLEVFESMAREVDRKDEYTKGHSDRVASLALLLARELGIRGHALKTIVAAALLHDIGKLKIEDNILKKPGRLTDHEFDCIQKHPEVGVELLRRMEFPWDIKPLILHHHEKLDGTGYPLGLKGEDIPLGARIICIVDVFDALTSDRVYRAAYDTERALAIMLEGSGSSFDPVLLGSFSQFVREGKADQVINSKTKKDEMFGIWSQCMDSEAEDRTAPERPAMESAV